MNSPPPGSPRKRQAANAPSQCDIDLLDGSSIHVDRHDDGTVLLVVDSGRDGVITRLGPAVAAYLAGRLAVAARVKLGQGFGAGADRDSG